MFATFLLVTVLASLAVLAALLAAPSPVGGGPMQERHMHWTGLAVAALLAALSFLGGLAMGS